MALTAAILTSCNDSDGDYPGYQPIWTTVHTIGLSDYYFTHNNGETLYPSDKSRIGAYEATEGQRAIIAFNILPEPIAGYNHNIALYGIRNILTKDPVTVTTEEQLKEIGDDNIQILDTQVGGGYLDIYFAATESSNHTLNLIVNKVDDASATAPEGYTAVEFRQSAADQISVYAKEGYVSFRLGELDPAVSGSKGLYIRFKNLSGNIEYLKAEIPAAK